MRFLYSFLVVLTFSGSACAATRDFFVPHPNTFFVRPADPGIDTGRLFPAAGVRLHDDIPKTLTEFPVDRLRMPLAGKREDISLFLATVTKAGGGHMLRWDTRDDWWFPDRTSAVSNEKSPVRQVPLSASAATFLAGLFLFAPCWMLERPDARRRRAVRTRFGQMPAERADGA